ncbi:MAG: ABC transporter permease [bacterium]
MVQKKTPLVAVSASPAAGVWSFWRFGRGLVLPVVLVISWWIVAKSGSFSPYLLPAPLTVLRTLIKLTVTGELALHIAASLKRVLIGFSLAVTLGLPLGLLVGLSSQARGLLAPTLRFLQHVPPIAWIPLFILWLGIGESSKHAVIVYAAFFPVFLNTLQGVAATDPRLVEVGRLYRLRSLELVREVFLPSAAPVIFTGLRLGLGYSWRALVSAELIAAPSGLGYLIVEARELSQPAVILCGVIVIGLVGLALEILLNLVEQHLRQRMKGWHSSSRKLAAYLNEGKGIRRAIPGNK